MPLETWVSLGSLLGVALALYVALKSDSRRLEAKIDRVSVELRNESAGIKSELTSDISKLRAEFKKGIDELRSELKGDVARLDDRVYALAAGLRPVLHPGGEHRSPAG